MSPKTMPTVSVIVPNYNHAPFLRRRIDSILRQTFQDFELILLDDCSTDDSRAILSEYAADPRVRLEFNEKNSGSTFKQWNNGVRLAQGKYIWLAESDDYADERLLARLVTLLEAEPEATFAYCRSWRISEDDQQDGFADSYLDYLDSHRWSADFCADGREECRNYFISINPIPNASAVVFRKVIYECVGGADESLRQCGDWKLWAAMALAGKIAYLGEPLNYYRSHDASVRSKSMRTGLNAAEALQVIRWILDRVTPTETVLQKSCVATSIYWVPPVISLHVPLSVKRVILRNAMAIDPHAIRRVLRPALVAVWKKLARSFRFVQQRFEKNAS
jgi:glycosyltransferase involved in cell wall biosynthesis